MQWVAHTTCSCTERVEEVLGFVLFWGLSHATSIISDGLYKDFNDRRSPVDNYMSHTLQ